MSAVAVAAGPGANVLGDMIHIAPMLLVGLWSLILLMADAFSGPGMRTAQRGLAWLGGVVALVAGLYLYGDNAYDGGVVVFGGFLVVDQMSLLLDLGILAMMTAVVLFAGDYARSHRFEYEEQEALLFIAAFGMMMLTHANDLVAVFLGIETMSLSVYVLVGARWNAKESSEAALKYFLMGAFASALLLMGIALMYGACGTTQFEGLRQGVSAAFTQWGGVNELVKILDRGLKMGPQEMDRVVQGVAAAALLIPGILLVLVGLLFKVAAVPFHMWTPDAYEGAPTPTTAFMASGVKIASVAVLLKLFVAILSTYRLVTLPYGWTSGLAVIAFLTMTVGNLAAVRQTNVKRLLGFSSIAHVGYLLVGVVAAANFYGQANAMGPIGEQIEWARGAGDAAVSAILYYVLTYAVASLGAFACVAWFSANKREALRAHQWAGLGKRHPGMALGMTIVLLSLMGLPPTAGFFGKLFVFRAAFENSNVWLHYLVIAALLNSVVGAYYYLRIIVAMYFRDPPEAEFETLDSSGARVTVGATAVASILLGLLAGPALDRTDLAATAMNFPPGPSKADRVDGLRAHWELRDGLVRPEPDDDTDRDAAGDADDEDTDGGDPPAADADAKAPLRPQ